MFRGMNYQLTTIHGDNIGAPHPSKDLALAHAARVLGVRAVYSENVGLSTRCYMTRAQRAAQAAGLVIVAVLAS